VKRAEEKEKNDGKIEEELTKPNYIHFGLNHVTQLVERGVAKLVLIAHDVDPVELVLWLPALCRKKEIPFMFVKGKARLGQFVHKKTATCIALTKINESDKKDFDKLIVNALANFNNNPNLLEPGMPILGHKS